MGRNRETKLILIFFFKSLLIAQLGASDNSDSTEKHILVLHSYHQGLEWTDNISEGIESVFRKRTDINLVYEYLDAKRNYNDEYKDALIKLYAVKAFQIPFKAIIISDNAAYEFMKNHSELFYPGIPVFYCGVNNLDTNELKEHQTFFGIEEKADHFGTLNSIVKIFPERKNILIVNDKSLTGNSIRQELDNIFPQYNGVLNFEIFSDFTMESLKEKVSSLDESWAIYLLVLNRDSHGNFISYRNGITQIKSVSKVPVFGSWDFYEGKGMIGGKIIHGFEQGEYVAKLVEKYLTLGSTANFSQYFYYENQYAFDYNELTKFNVTPDRLPEGSKIINQPAKGDTYYKVFVGLAIVLLIVIFVLFITLRLRRKRALYLENEILERTAELSKTNAELEDVIEKKDKFFSILAHDIKNQVSAILNAALLINNDKFFSQPQKAALVKKDLLHIANKTYSLLEDILYWGMQQFNKQPALQFSEFDLKELISCITETYEVNQNNVRFEYNFENGLKLNSDYHICNFIFRNIIQNAIKFSPEKGLVRIISESDNNIVSLSVIDQGIGLSEEEIKRIYNKNPVKKEGQMGQTGTGLGLITVLDYLEYLNGKLIIESDPGNGAVFKVVFEKQSN